MFIVQRNKAKVKALKNLKRRVKKEIKKGILKGDYFCIIEGIDMDTEGELSDWLKKKGYGFRIKNKNWDSYLVDIEIYWY